MYAKGMTTRQISETIEDIYGFETSEGFISDVTNKILPQIEDWQNRPLDEVYPILYIDAIHYSVRDNGVITPFRLSMICSFVVLRLWAMIFCSYISSYFAPSMDFSVSKYSRMLFVLL